MQAKTCMSRAGICLHLRHARGCRIASEPAGKPGKRAKTYNPDLQGQSFRSINSFAPSGLAKSPEILAFHSESTKGCRVLGFASEGGQIHCEETL
jgi:hypothetical protein